MIFSLLLRCIRLSRWNCSRYFVIVLILNSLINGLAAVLYTGGVMMYMSPMVVSVYLFKENILRRAIAMQRRTINE